MDKNATRSRIMIMIISMLALLSIILFGGCANHSSGEITSEQSEQYSNDEEISKEVEVFLFKRTNISMLVYEDITLELEDDVEAKSLSWRSTNESVATIDNGVVTAKKVGEVSIIAENADGLKDVCKIKVIDNLLIPTISLNVDNNGICLYEDSSYKIDVTLKYNGNDYNDFTCLYNINNTDIATVDNDGNVESKNTGKDSIDLIIQWRGLEIAKKIDVNVIKTSYISVDKEFIEIYAVNPNGYTYETSSVIVPKLYNINDEEITNVEFTITEEDASGVEKGYIAEVDGYIIKAKEVGTTKFICKCVYGGDEYESKLIAVNVKPCNIYLDDYLYTKKTNSVVDIKSIIDCDLVEDLLIDNKTATIDNNTNANIDELAYGEHEIEFSIDGETRVRYKSKIVVADYLISTVEELKAISNPTGYYVLTNDIDADGTLFNKLFNANWFSKIDGEDSTLFQGVFDGVGHSILNINVEGFGLFGNIGIHGVIKNIGFYNVFARGSGSVDFGLATDLYGKIENVSFHSDSTENVRAVIGRVNKGSSIKNVVVITPNSTLGLVDSNGGANTTLYDNIFVISSGFSGHTNTFAKNNCYNISTYKNELEYSDFDQKYDMSNNGIWHYDETLKLPLITKVIIQELKIGNSIVSIDGSISFDSFTKNITVRNAIYQNKKCLKILPNATNWQGIAIRFNTPLTKNTATKIRISYYSGILNRDIYFAAGDTGTNAWSGVSGIRKSQKSTSATTLYTIDIDISGFTQVQWISVMPNAGDTTSSLYIVNVELIE